MTRFSSAALALLASLATPGPVRAGDTQSFIIAPRDGYGVSECLEKAAPCGRVIADAWCEAHGLSKALSYGHVEDVTATIPKAVSAQGPVVAQTAAATQRTTATTLAASGEKIEPGSYVINCQQ